MKLSVLLDELQHIVLRDVHNAVQGTGSTLWTPVSLVRYLDEAHKRFASKTKCIVDATTPDVTEIQLVAGQDSYELNESVLGVLNARLLLLDGHVELEPTSDYHQSSKRSNHVNISPSIIPTALGIPLFFSYDEARRIKVYPTPRVEDEGLILKLRVQRLPLVEFALDAQGDPLDIAPEIPAEYHLELCEWAAYRALRNHDTDGENLPKATTHRNSFERAVLDCREESRRRMIPPATFGGSAPN